MCLTEKLKKYDLFLTLSKVASLLTIPSLHANLHRIEHLIYLIVLNCKKSNLSPTSNEIKVWLNKYLSRSEEDPIEDVFVTNIITPLGNFRIFEGLWTSNDFYVQKTIDVLYSQSGEFKKLLLHIFELLKLSDVIVKKSNLERWDYSEQTNPQGDIKLPNKLDKEVNRVIFNLKDLQSLGIHIEFLAPFLLKREDITTLKKENYGYSELENKPLIYLRDKLIVALPNAIGSAIRNYVISEFKKSNSIDKLEKMFFEHEIRLIETPTISPLYNLISKNKVDHGITHSIPLLKDWLVKYDLDKYLHVILYHAPVNHNDSNSITDEKISLYIEDIRKFCESQKDFNKGITLIILGSDGLTSKMFGNIKALENMKNSWYASLIPTYNFLKFSAPFDNEKWSLKNYLKFLSQKQYLENKGMKFFSIDGDYNLYCLWYNQDCCLVSKDIPDLLYALPDISFSLNKWIRKSLDSHVSKDITGKYFPVMNYNISSYSSSIVNLPIYISLHHLFNEHILKIVIENRNNTPKWLMIKCKPDFMNVCHTLLNSGLNVLYQKIVFEIEKLYKDKVSGVLEVCLNFEEINLTKEVIDKNQPINKSEILFDFKKNRTEIKFPYNFFHNFNNPDNKGEKEIIKYIAISLMCLYEKKEKEINNDELDILLSKVIKKGVRILHVFNKDPLYHFVHDKITNFEWTDADGVFTRIKILQNFSNKKYGTLLKGQDAQVFLNSLFQHVFLHIKLKLKLFDRNYLIYKLIEIYESKLHEDEHWNRTIGAFISIYEDGKEVAEIKNRDRDSIKQSVQILLEIAICECPEKGGKKISRWDIDELLAESLFLLEVALDSDILINDLCIQEIKIENSGEYTIDKTFFCTSVRPFVQDTTFLRYKQQSQRYKELYTKKSQTNKNELAVIDNNFIFEFGLSIKDLRTICNVLLKIAIDKSSVAVETTTDEIKRRCKENELSDKVIQSFMHSFTIFYRPDWTKPPDGFNMRDIFPSKYNRRLSFNVRPLLAVNKLGNSKVFYGIGNIYKAMYYLLYQIEEGNFPADFFKTKQMKSFCGEINQKKGDQFNKKVASKLRNMNWNVKLNLEMSQLGASNSLGDIDILAWKDNQIKIIESKRLQPARNINEIVNSLKRFKGEDNDLLTKHINRVNWIKNNLDSISNIIGFIPNLDCVGEHIVTNILIPSQYVDFLLLKSESIIQIDELENKF